MFLPNAVDQVRHVRLRPFVQHDHGDAVGVVEQDAAATDLGVERLDAQEVGVELDDLPVNRGRRGRTGCAGRGRRTAGSRGRRRTARRRPRTSRSRIRSGRRRSSSCGPARTACHRVAGVRCGSPDRRCGGRTGLHGTLFAMSCSDPRASPERQPRSFVRTTCSSSPCWRHAYASDIPPQQVSIPILLKYGQGRGMVDHPIGDGRIEVAFAHFVSPRIARRYRSADRLTAALPSRSITMSQNAPYTRSYSNGSTAWTIRSMAEADSGM